MWHITTILLILHGTANGLPSNPSDRTAAKIQDKVEFVLRDNEVSPIVTNINNLIVNIGTQNIFQNGISPVSVSNQRADRELDWWETTIFYQIYPRSFKDSDGDGIGDLKGITSKLEHLKDLGIGATWLSPIFKSPMYDFGYDISDFYNIQEEYGTMEDFENLLKKAKELDIKIVLDFVPNHGSNESEWFQKSLQRDSLYGDYFIWEKGTVDAQGNRKPPSNWVSAFRKSAWEYREERGEYYLHQFVIGQPDLNYRNPNVAEEMKNVLRFWLEKGVAGYRMDAVNHLFEVDKADFGGVYPDEPRTGDPNLGPDDFGYLKHIYTQNQSETLDMLYQWREVLDEYAAKDGETKVILSEACPSVKDTMRYYGDGVRNGAHMPFNFGLLGEANKDSSAKDIKYISDEWLTYMPLGLSANWVIGNHDSRRVASRFGPERVDSINMLILSMPGVAITYMGEEIGMQDGYVSWEDTVDPQACNTDDPIKGSAVSRDPARTPFQWNNGLNAGFSDGPKTWLPVADTYPLLNVETQKNAVRSHIKVYKAVSDLRKSATYKYGDFQSVAFNDAVFSFVRRLSGEPSYVMVWNMSGSPQTVDLTYFSGLTSKLEVAVTNIDSPREVGNIVEASTLALSPYETLILRTTGLRTS